MGLMIPDLGILFKYLNFYNEFHGTILHSVIFALFLFVTLLIISEINTRIIDKKIINGVFMGILIHIFLDLVISGEGIIFYWPLPIEPIHSLFEFKLTYELLYILSCLQFLLLRYFGYKLNDMLVRIRYLEGNCCENINTI